MSASKSHEWVIVGAGASGVLLAWQLAQRVDRPITVIDPAELAGLGLAYATPSLSHVLNVPAAGMSASPTEPEHFLEWLRRRIDPQAQPGAFIPRAVYGLYLRELALASRAQFIRGQVLACRPDPAGWTLQLTDGRTIAASQVVLATGHHAPRRLAGDGSDDPRYAGDAWHDHIYATMPRDAHVGLIGSGLTMVDALLRLRQQGHRGPVTAISGHGLVPQTHAVTPALAAPVVDLDKVLPTARGYLHQFKLSLRAGVAWRSAVDSLRSVSNRLWLALPAHEQQRFRRHLQRRWDVARHRMAPQVGDQLQLELSAGRLQLVTGRVETVTAEASGLCLRVRRSGVARALRFDRVINCSGPDVDYRRAGSPLLQSLLLAGYVRPGAAGIGLDCDLDGQAIGRDGAIVAGLYLLGPARLGRLFESVAMPELRQQALALAERLARPAAMSLESSL